MSLNITKANDKIREAREIIVLVLDPYNGAVYQRVMKMASLEFFADGTFVAKDNTGKFYPSAYYIADEDDFGIFGDYRDPVTCWTTRKTLYAKIMKSYISAMNAHLIAEEESALKRLNC